MKRPGSQRFRTATRIALSLVAAGLAGCASLPGATLLGGLGIFGEPSEFTATRAQIAAAGITTPLIKVEIFSPRPESAGFLLATTANGIDIYRDQGGSELFLDRGVLRSSVGQRIDLLGADTSPVHRAFEGGSPRYTRVLRHRSVDGPVISTRFFCAFRRDGAENVTILGLTTVATRYSENCQTAEPDTLGNVQNFENRYWLDSVGRVTASEQWLNQERGTLRIEQVQR
ncbi:MAG: YjbF family lipoprotein [Pseudomonadota bacterium]